MKANDVLKEAAALLDQRAAQRDSPTGERSMHRAINIYSAIKGHSTINTDVDGWLFMVALKLARSQAGAYNRDDYLDAAAYIALAVEDAEAAQKKHEEYLTDMLL